MQKEETGLGDAGIGVKSNQILTWRIIHDSAAGDGHETTKSRKREMRMLKNYYIKNKFGAYHHCGE